MKEAVIEEPLDLRPEDAVQLLGLAALHHLVVVEAHHLHVGRVLRSLQVALGGKGRLHPAGMHWAPEYPGTGPDPDMQHSPRTAVTPSTSIQCHVSPNLLPVPDRRGEGLPQNISSILIWFRK